MTTLWKSRNISPGGLKLLLIAAAAAVLWLVILPAIASLPAVQSRIEFNEERGIDPAAMFYTDHPLHDSRRPRQAGP